MLLDVTSFQIGIVDHRRRRYYTWNELRFLSGLPFGVDAEGTRGVVVERGGAGESEPNAHAEGR